MPFHNKYSQPTNAQYEAIGRVVANWAVVEDAIESVLARLTGATDYFGRALTNDLSPDNRAKALKNLSDIHRVQFGYHVVQRETLDSLDELRKEFIAAKEQRNKIAHWIAFRRTDDRISFIRLRSKPAVDAKVDDLAMTHTVNELNTFANYLIDLRNRFEKALDNIPQRIWP